MKYFMLKLAISGKGFIKLRYACVFFYEDKINFDRIMAV